MPEEYFEELKTIALGRIRQEANKNDLLNKPGLAFILHHWKKWSTVEEPRECVSRLVSSDEGVIKLLVSVLSEVYSSTAEDYIARKRWEIRQNGLQEFINPEDLLPKVKSIKQRIWESLSDREKIAVDAFLRSGQKQSCD